MRDIAMLVLPLIAAAFAALIVSWALFPLRLARLLPGSRRVLFSVRTNEKVVALTIDDAPTEHTREILSILLQHRCHATFFVIGEYARQRPDIVKEIVKQGHEIGNHTMKDEPSWRMTAAAFEKSLLDTEEVLAQTLASREAGVSWTPVRKWFRPGCGVFTRDMLDTAQRNGYAPVLGTVYPRDTHIKWPRFMRAVVARAVRPGGIIILHDRSMLTAELGRVLDDLTGRGYTVDTLSALHQRNRD